jgi:hypothetical protein
MSSVSGGIKPNLLDPGHRHVATRRARADIVKPIGIHLFDAQNPKTQPRSRDERAPFGLRDRASLFVDFADDEMTLLVEMIVDLSMN